MPLLLLLSLALTRNDSPWVVAAIVLTVVLSCLLGSAALAVTIENRTAAGARVVAAVSIVVAGLSIVVAHATHSATAVWAVRVAFPAFSLFLMIWLLDKSRRRVIFQLRLPRDLGRTFWRYSMLTWVSGLVSLLVYSRSEIFLLQIFHKTGALGLFALAFGLAGVLTAPADAMLHALLPAVAGILSAWPERAAPTFERSTRVSAVVCGGLAAILVPAVFFLVPVLYGPGFKSAAWLFVPLALLSIFQSVNNPVMAFVNGRRRGGLLLKTGLVSLAVDLVVAVALIPPFGAWGAVAANLAGQLVGLIWLTVAEPLAAERGLGGMLRLYRPFLFGSVLGLLALAVGSVLRPHDVAAAAVAGSAGGLVYLFVVRLTGAGLSEGDRDALAGAFAAPMRPYIVRILSPITSQT
jgi:O-antigen/teichoic acid export membrane protein